MTERRFRLELRDGCLWYEAMGVRVKGEDNQWRYWLEFDGCCIPGHGVFPPTRAGYARLKVCAREQLARIVWPPRRLDVPEDMQ